MSKKPTVQPEPVENDLPRKIPSTCMVKPNRLKLKNHLDNFNKVIKFRTKVTGQNEESFKNFDRYLYKEVNEMKEIFIQMETEVDQCFVDRKYFEIENKELLIKNDRLLEKIMSQDIMCNGMHSSDNNVKNADLEKSFATTYNQ
ncbi:hypothetical protein Tco_1424505 [Tanacetum coccineum]